MTLVCTEDLEAEQPSQLADNGANEEELIHLIDDELLRGKDECDSRHSEAVPRIMLTRRQLVSIKAKSKGIRKQRGPPSNDLRRRRTRSEEVDRLGGDLESSLA